MMARYISLSLALLLALPAMAQDRHRGQGGGQNRAWYNPKPSLGRDIAVGVGTSTAGNLLGGWLWRKWAQPEPPPPPPPPQVVVVQQPPAPVRTIGWCMDRYKSYDPYTRTYLGYDGYRHSCP